MSASTEFAASLPFFSYRQRNAVIDNFFYDNASLTLEEKAKLSPLVDREGSIIVVPPSNSDRQIRHYKRALRFMNKEGPTIRAIAVAGVGSSALGTAALARNIADALDTDVAGIVTVRCDDRGARRLVRVRGRRPDQIYDGEVSRAHALHHAGRHCHVRK